DWQRQLHERGSFTSVEEQRRQAGVRKAGPPPDDKDPKVRISEAAASMAADLGELIWDGEHAYLVARESGHVRTLAVRSKAFRLWLHSKLKAHGDRPPSNPQQWSAAMESLEARAAEGGTGLTPSIRVASLDGAIYIDLGDDSWRCVKVTTEGWSVIPHPADGPYFYRPPRLAALPEPKSNGDLADLWTFFNVRADDRPLLLAYLVQALRPRGPYPILSAHGPAGATKTTFISAIKALTDPTLSSPESPALTSPRKPPREERDVIAAARNNRVVAFDNVSYLDQWLSDALCRLATGAELGGRANYTDFDEAVFVASRPVMLNGIPDVVRQSDLADRCVKVECRKPPKRIPEATYWHRFKREWPILLGVVLDLYSAVLRHWTEAAGRVPDDADVRMRDFARIGEALGLELGWAEGEFTHLYADNLGNAAAEIAHSDPITKPLIHLLRERGGSWEGTTQELLTKLGGALNESDPTRSLDIKNDREWPRSPHKLAARLARLSTALEAVGVVVSETYRSNGRSVRRIDMCTGDVHSTDRQNGPNEAIECT
ncbi:MAG TPA: hypothetical protein VE596_13840, partial [Gaiellaceae bacterium]|nr:hypothetical protein [Gaiellaceae bacterium]